MAKQSRKKSRRQKRKSHRRSMKGGDFSDQERILLQNNGFNQYQIQRLNDIGVTYDQVNQQINNIAGDDFHGNADDLADAVEQALFEEHMDQGIPHNQDDEHHMDVDLNESFGTDAADDSLNMSNLDQSFGYDNESNGSLHMSDLGNESHNESGYTTDQDDSFNIGGKKKRRTVKKRKQIRKSSKTKKPRKQNRRKSRKQKGGMCYGNGVGANSYDPNFSINNTNLLKLFPYRPTN